MSHVVSKYDIRLNQEHQMNCSQPRKIEPFPIKKVTGTTIATDLFTPTKEV
ncbi:hypothetical protein SAMN04490180_0675 [Pseudomonas brassicacearum]|jgi:hypothetical protein|nr:hypothetical protein SAMN04490180_0675 [Pseudomonas brassicacearum]